MFTRPIILFLVAICLFQILQGGVTRRIVPRSADESDTSGNMLDSFNSLLNESSALQTMMQSLNSSLQSLGSSLDELGNLLKASLANATRVLNETSTQSA
ncbi:hypothetical protein L9F63_009688 [Diploptera punctata]|uniref:Uncharacterized protein n=1 Tax=Diploptera punctata TaxID=6984 RepID=A0AAD8AIW7_DIPPU|nr:hypothetical protein L9F63_009688 [Diploptera punctata]